ncbi:hypothetical protein GW17_00030486 [Ensete ventricosum]|nr:hypothetical protein GW17_00030486 [Ensete ventricosum]
MITRHCSILWSPREKRGITIKIVRTPYANSWYACIAFFEFKKVVWRCIVNAVYTVGFGPYAKVRMSWIGRLGWLGLGVEHRAIVTLVGKSKKLARVLIGVICARRDPPSDG